VFQTCKVLIFDYQYRDFMLLCVFLYQAHNIRWRKFAFFTVGANCTPNFKFVALAVPEISRGCHSLKVSHIYDPVGASIVPFVRISSSTQELESWKRPSVASEASVRCLERRAPEIRVSRLWSWSVNVIQGQNKNKVEVFLRSWLWRFGRF